MRDPQPLAELEQSLRGLIAAEAFEDAQRLLDLFAEAVENEIARASGDPALLLEMSTRVGEFFAWAEARTKAQRSCDESEVCRLRSLGRYDIRPPFAGGSATA